MKRPRISIRFLLLLVAAMAIPFAVDQLLERKMRALAEAIKNDPASVVASSPDVEGFKCIHVDWDYADLTTLADRLMFRRKFAVTYDEIKYEESPAGVTGAILRERQRNLLVTPISTSTE